MKVITIGSGMRDIFIQHSQIKTHEIITAGHTECFVLLREGAKIEVDDIEYYTGGGATNSGISFKRFGFETTTFCKVGNDIEGQDIIQKLTRESINTEFIKKTPDALTGTSFIIPCPSGERTVLVYRGANLTIQKNEIPYDAIKDSNFIYITSLSGNTAQLLTPIADYAKQHNCTVATNPGTSQLKAGADALRDTLPYIDILILNAYEASILACSIIEKSSSQQFASDPNLPSLLREGLHHNDTFCSLPDYFAHILNAGPRIAVVTNGAEGVYVSTKNTIYFHPSLPTKVVSTLGAGDAFGSCFVASLMYNKSIEESLVCGIINASSVIESLDAKTGLLTVDELASRLKKFDTKDVQCF